MAQEIEIEGLIELQKFMGTLPKKIERNVMIGGMRAGAKAFKTIAKLKVPVGEPSKEGKRLYGHYRGALRDSIRVSAKVTFGQIIARVIAGGRNKKTGADVFYAHLVEFGTKRHKIKGVKGASLRIGGTWIGKSVIHEGAQRKRFMRPAFDTGSRAAIRETAKKIRQRLLTKHGINTRPVTVPDE